MDLVSPEIREHLARLGFTALTPPQEEAIPVVLARKHLLLLAPTGYGKTEAALIPVFQQFLKLRKENGKPAGISILYVTPLRALNRDMLKRTLDWGAHLGIEIGVRHGDTTQAERARQSRRPPDMLITTPETVQVLFTGSRLRRHLASVQWVVVDEVHELANSERGAQFAVALERLEELRRQALLRAAGRAQGNSRNAEALRAGPRGAEARAEVAGFQPGQAGDEDAGPEPLPLDAEAPSTFQRIGLSATVGSPDAVARFLAGAHRPVTTLVSHVPKVYEISVESPKPGPESAAWAAKAACDLHAASVLQRVKALFDSHRATLLFSNTRDGAEVLATRLHLAEEGQGIGVHHGSLSRDVRIEMEEDYKAARLKALICTSSLELGIDVGQTDLVVQYNSPRGIERLIQRVGRAGHRAGDVSRGVVLCTSAEEYLEAAVVARRGRVRDLPPLRMRKAPLEVLANQLLALLQEYWRLPADWAYGVLIRADPFRELPRERFDAVVATLAAQRSLFVDRSPGEEGAAATTDAGRVRTVPPGHLVLSGGANTRRYFLDNISMIPDERAFKVIDASSRRSIGKLDESFVVSSLEPSSRFILRGRPWAVLEIQPDAVLVAPVKELGDVPNWVGEDLPVTFPIAMEVGALRRRMASGEPAESLAAEYGTDPEGMKDYAAVVARTQARGLQVPTDRLATIEVATKILVLNGTWGTQVNETLGRILSALLAQRLGTSVALSSDAYRITLTGSERLDPNALVRLLESIEPDTLPDLVKLALRNSSFIRWQLVHVARKFGALSKELDPSRFSMRTLLDRFAKLPLHDEALAKIVHERMDLDATAEVLRRIRSREIGLAVQRLSPFSTLGAEARRDLMAPSRADRTILQSLRNRLMEAEVALGCLNCGRTWQSRVERAVLKCAQCNAILVAAVHPFERDALKLIPRDPVTLTDAERQKVAWVRKGANLVASYGKKALIALVARGVGPETASRILARQREDEWEFLRDILEAELTYARTRSFWDR